MKNQSSFSSFFNFFCSCARNQDEIYFFETKASLEKYERESISVHAVNKLATLAKNRKNSRYSSSIMVPISIYINNIFLLVHSGYHFAEKNDVAEHYFGLLAALYDYFVLAHKEFSEFFNDKLKDLAFKALLALQTWEKIILNSPNCLKYGGSYGFFARQYFEAFFSKEFSGYEKFLLASYQSCAESIDIDFMKPIFIDLSAGYQPNKLNTEANNNKFFSEDDKHADSSKQPLLAVKYKTA